MNFFEKPLIPDRDAKNIIASCKIGNIKPARPKGADERISYHADISLCHVGGKRFVTSADTYEYYVKSLEGAEIIKGEAEVKSPYPYDAAYSAAVFGKIAVSNERITDKVLLDILKSEFTFVNVRQGYAKCGICPISEDAVITEDEGIYRALSDYADVLLIQKGFVNLEGYSYGFIGGASGLIGPGKLFFNGSIEKHPDYFKIADFLEKHSVSAVTLPGELTDVGSIIAIS